MGTKTRIPSGIVRYFVYTISCPDTLKVVYVGITANIRQRFKEHLACTGTNGDKNEWIKSLPRKPIFSVIDICERYEVFNLEAKYINKYCKQYPLFNIQRNKLKPKPHRIVTIDVVEIRKKRCAGLKNMRMSAGLNKAEFSRLSGLHRNTIEILENGTVNYNIESEIVYMLSIQEYSEISKTG